jgi:hypothetical protein
MNSNSLSKSKYIRGIRCHKSLWLKMKGNIEPTPNSELLSSILEEGTRVGEIAQELFPGGKLIEFEGSGNDEKITRTNEWIASGETTIYEATFKFNDIVVMVDILTKGDNGWEFYEVKSVANVYNASSEVKIKEIYVNDIAIQYYVLKGSGLDISSSFLVHINNQYVRQGPLDKKKLFSIVDLTEDAIGTQSKIDDELGTVRKVLDGDEPEIDIGVHCSEPHECEFKAHCWKGIPKENTVFNISGLKASKKFELYKSGVTMFEDIPNNYSLSDNQRLQVEAELSGKETVDLEQINNFLKTLYYPLCFLDFETIRQVVPEWEGIMPYKPIPFQYSIHFIEKEGDSPKHLEFLYEENSDPRKSLIDKLIEHIPKGACILTWTDYEARQIRGLAQQFPDYSNRLLNFCENIIDLSIPFKEKYFYKKEMKGSYSIKKVLPALLGHSPYSEMDINEGLGASNNFIKLLSDKNLTQPEREKIKNDLKIYCKQDTQGMIDVLEYLKKIAKK